MFRRTRTRVEPTISSRPRQREAARKEEEESLARLVSTIRHVDCFPELQFASESIRRSLTGDGSFTTPASMLLRILEAETERALKSLELEREQEQLELEREQEQQQAEEICVEILREYRETLRNLRGKRKMPSTGAATVAVAEEALRRIPDCLVEALGRYNPYAIRVACETCSDLQNKLDRFWDLVFVAEREDAHQQRITITTNRTFVKYSLLQQLQTAQSV